MKHVLLGLMAAAAASANAGEAAPYAKVIAVNGKVTVSSKSQMVPAAVGMQLTQGATVLPGSDAGVTVLFASGCQVTAKAGQVLTVDEGVCSATVAKARTVQGAAGSAATGGEVAGVSTTGLIVGGVAAALVINQVTKSDSPAPAPAPVAAAPSPAPAPAPATRPPARTPARAPSVSGS